MVILPINAVFMLCMSVFQFIQEKLPCLDFKILYSRALSDYLFHPAC